MGQDDDVYTIATSKEVTRLDGATGAKVWATRTQGMSYAGPVQSSDGTLYADTTGGKVFALRPDTGAVLWSLQIGVTIHTRPLGLEPEGLLIVGSVDRTLYAVRIGKPGVTTCP